MSKLPEDGAEAPKHEGAFLIYIYIYIYMCVCVCVWGCVHLLVQIIINSKNARHVHKNNDNYVIRWLHNS